MALVNYTRRALLALPVAAVLVAAAACSGTSQPAPNSSSSGATGYRPAEPLPTLTSTAKLPFTLPQPSTVNDQDANAVSQAVVTITWSMDTVTDASQYQAELRAGPFLTADYLASLKANPPVAAPGADWNTWAAHEAWTTVTAVREPDDQPIDSSTMARRQWGVTITPHGANGWTGSPESLTAFVTMTRTGSGPWLVSGITVSS